MKLIIFFVSLISTSLADSWNNHKLKFGITSKSPSEETRYAKRFRITQKNVEEHNKNPKNSYKMALNQFSHLTYEEFSNISCGTKSSKKIRSDIPNINMKEASIESNYPFGNYTMDTAPNSTDFRYLMQPVQNQRGCGACWAFATLSQLEGILKIRDPSFNLVLSQQYLVDCDNSNNACRGGWPQTSMSKFN